LLQKSTDIFSPNITSSSCQQLLDKKGENSFEFFRAMLAKPPPAASIKEVEHFKAKHLRPPLFFNHPKNPNLNQKTVPKGPLPKILSLRAQRARYGCKI
jgi:hypothetical protein